ncbi:MAG TPA: hypothetical protein VLA78_03060 [Paracoccaceae bacterium]|nr:hypothetical protein [Paracoccaceae bacterium]
MTRMLFALSLGFAGLILATEARANAQCAPRDQVITHLGTKYAETRRGIGIAANNTVMEIYASDGGSWTIVVTTAQGLTCLVASGHGYESLTEELPARGAPA